VESLRDRGYRFVSVTEFAGLLTTSGAPSRVCALTFDDGSDDPLLLEILSELRVPATLYVCPSLLGQPHPWLRPDAGVRLMSLDTLRDVSRLPYIEIGSHTNTHVDLRAASHDDAFRELSSSRRTLEDMLDRPVLSVAYPFCHYSPACPPAAERAGYLSAVTCEGRGGWVPFELRREGIAAWDGRVSFALKSRGAGHAILRSRLGRLALRVRRSG
jgi:peptidoglycan/xylan/chitin deacetylase (PgdA/CDA1 family)